MRKIGIAALLAFLLMFTVTSIVKAQSAEELAKSQNTGVSYTHRFVADNGSPVTETVTIRGDEVTWYTEGPPEYRFPSGMEPRARIINKHMEGNKLILETDNPVHGILRKITIDGNRLTMGCPGIFTRE